MMIKDCAPEVYKYQEQVPVFSTQPHCSKQRADTLSTNQTKSRVTNEQ